jgi:hypothetical protein
MAHQKRRRPIGGKVEVRVTSDFKDIVKDAKLLFGYHDKRFNESKEVLNSK